MCSSDLAKLVDAAKRYGIRTAMVEEAAAMDLTAYDRSGIASGAVDFYGSLAD